MRDAGETSAADGRGAGARLMLVVSEGCRLGMGLESVDGVFDLPAAASGESAPLPDGGSVPLLRWSEVAGVAPASSPPAAPLMLVVRTACGPVGLAAQSCLGVREARFTAGPLLPTRLLGPAGDALCFVHLLDHRPYFLVDPQALAQAVARRSTSPAASGPRASGSSTKDEPRAPVREG